MAIGFRGVGVLALQGGYNAHIKKLRAMGALIREVRTPKDLANIDGLVLPGGESTTMGLGIEREGLGRPLREFVNSGKPVLATCAGAILLDDAHMGLVDISCDRNAYGASTHSFEAEFPVRGVDGDDFRGLELEAVDVDAGAFASQHAGDAVEQAAAVARADGEDPALRALVGPQRDAWRDREGLDAPRDPAAAGDPRAGRGRHPPTGSARPGPPTTADRSRPACAR